MVHLMCGRTAPRTAWPVAEGEDGGVIQSRKLSKARPLTVVHDRRHEDGPIELHFTSPLFGRNDPR